MKRYFALVILMAGLCGGLWALAPAKQVGHYAYTFAFIHIYDAKLMAPEGKFNPAKPFGLALTYHLGLKGSKIVARSVWEMKKQGVKPEDATKWGKQLAGMIPDVKKGDVLFGERLEDGSLRMSKNGKVIGTLRDAALTEAFFNIWVGPRTTEPEQRAKLLGIG